MVFSDFFAWGVIGLLLLLVIIVGVGVSHLYDCVKLLRVIAESSSDLERKKRG